MELRRRWVLAVIAATSRALAAPFEAPAAGGSRIRLEWQAPWGCPTAADVIADADRLLGGGSTGASPVPARGHVTHQRDRSFSLVLSLGGAEADERHLAAPTCAALAEAAALILALAVDPDAVARARRQHEGSPPGGPPRDAERDGGAAASAVGTPRATAPAAGSPVGAPEVAPPARGASDAPTARVVTRQSSRARARKSDGSREPPSAFRPFVAAHALADAGALPAPAGGGGAAVGFASAALRLELAAAHFAPQRATIDPHPSAGGRFAFSTVATGACVPVRSTERVALAPCAALELGRMHAAAFGVSDPGEGWFVWTAAHAGAAVRVRLISPLSLAARFDAVVPLRRPVWTLSGVGPLDRPAPVGGRLRIGAEIAW